MTEDRADLSAGVTQPCVECGEVETHGPYICDDCTGESMMQAVRKYERIAREEARDGEKWLPNFRKLAFEQRKEMRELGVTP